MKVIDLVKGLVRAQQIDAGSKTQLEELVQERGQKIDQQDKSLNT